MSKDSRPVRISKRQVEAGVVMISSSSYTEISLSRLRSRLSEILNRVQYGRECVLVTNYGKRVALLVPVPKE
jgi:prevent-host-death family protein